MIKISYIKLYQQHPNIMSNTNRRTQIKHKLNSIPTINGNELYNQNQLPKYYYLDDGYDDSVGCYIDGRKGRTSIKRIGGISVSTNNDWCKRISN